MLLYITQIEMTLRHAATCVLGAFAVAAVIVVPVSADAENVKIGLLRNVPSGPVFIAQEKRFFAAEGISADLVYFDSSEPIALAVVSGDVDFAITGFTASVYNLASHDAIRIIAGAYNKSPGFQTLGYVVSKSAYAAGLTSLKNLSGRSVAVTQIGSPPHYSLGLLAEKYGLDLNGIRLMPLQSIPNVVSAIAGAKADAAVLNATAAMPLVRRGDAMLLGWVGDETPWQLAAIFASSKTARERHDTVERFLRAYRQGTRAFHDAFTGADERRRDNVSAPEILGVLSKYIGQSPEQISGAITYVDADARLDVKDVLHQIAWYKSEGMVKLEVDGDKIIDERYVIPLP